MLSLLLFVIFLAALKLHIIVLIHLMQQWHCCFLALMFHRDVLNWELHSSFSAIPFLLFIITGCLFTVTKFDFLCQIFMTQSEIR